MPEAAQPYEDTQRLEVPVNAAWDILTGRCGARRWLDDDTHPGITVGASFPVPDNRPAEITGIRRRKSIELSFQSGRRAVIEFRYSGERQCELAVRDDGGDGRDVAALRDSWSAVLRAACYLADQVRASRSGRQAIVVIHSVGSQRPLSTVRSLTHALVGDAKRWNKPDQMSDSYELRRFQLTRGEDRPRTDLFELYWADEIPGTQVGQVLSWLRSIMFRRPSTVSGALRPIAYLCWATLVLAAAAVLALLLTIGIDGIGRLWTAESDLAQVAWISTGLSLLSATASSLLIGTLGNAARYLDVTPGNLAVRQSIRQHGVDLLRRLHAEGGYDRIVIVGHSLGSVIGYDIIRLYWSQVHQEHGSTGTASQPALEAYQRLLTTAAASGLDVAKHRQAQLDLWREYRRHGHPWLVTDLITIGSPLTHAGTLLARSPADLDTLISDLELPTCPPHYDPKELAFADSYFADGNIRWLQVLPHAAPFAVTRWTNIYAPVRGIVAGDPIGGALAPVFGNGIKDISVRLAPWWRANSPLAHTSYWRRAPGTAPSAAVRALLEAIDLESGRWLEEHLTDMPWEMSVGEDRA